MENAPSLATLRSMAGKVNPLEGRYREYEAIAPDGKRWVESDAHSCLVVYESGGWIETDAGCRTALAKDIAGGLYDCPADCDCREE